MNISLFGNQRFEVPILNDGIFYERMESVLNEPVAIYIFHNVVINPEEFSSPGANKKTIHLKGTWFPIMDCGGHYGHYIKEGVGAFLYCRSKMPDLKPVFFEFMTADPIGITGARKLINDLNQELAEEFGDPKNIYRGPVFFENRIFIDKLVIMMDNGRMFFRKHYPFFNEHMAPELSKSLFKHFDKYKQDDPTYPKKIYVSRRLATKAIENANFTNHEHFKKRYFEPWVEDALENAFKDNGYTVIDFAEMDFADQVKYPHNATHFASISGTAFHNGIWCKNGTTFYCIRPNNLYLFDWKHDIVKSLEDVSWNHVDPWECSDYDQLYDFVVKQLKA